MDLMTEVTNLFILMLTNISIERQKPYIVWITGDAGARNGAFELCEEFDNLAQARAYARKESAKIIKQNKKNVVRTVEKL